MYSDLITNLPSINVFPVVMQFIGQTNKALQNLNFFTTILCKSYTFHQGVFQKTYYFYKKATERPKYRMSFQKCLNSFFRHKRLHICHYLNIKRLLQCHQ